MQEMLCHNNPVIPLADLPFTVITTFTAEANRTWLYRAIPQERNLFIAAAID